jgi:geranylgeranyl pyrophosphate synthase
LVLSDMEPQQAGKIASSFECLGIAFQIFDDIKDVYSDKGRGQIGNDLREGKISALTIAHLEACPKDRPALTRLLKKPFNDVSKDEVLFWKKRFTSSGASQACETWAHSFVEKASLGVHGCPLAPLMEQTILALGLKN